MKKLVFGLFAAVVSFAPEVNAQTTALYYTSSPESYVGAGETRLVTPNDGFSFTAWRNWDNGVSLSLLGQPITLGWWHLHFAAPGDALLTPGTYLDATRWGPQSPTSPGLTFEGNARANNMLTGYFTVLEIQYGPGDTIESFAADFVQYDEGVLAWWNQGSIRFNSMVPVPEPSTYMLLIAGGLALWAVRRGRRAESQQAVKHAD